MKIMAIDPGNEQSAFCVIDTETLKPMQFAKLENDELLRIVRNIRETPAVAVVIERVASYGMAVGREVFETCEWTGRFTEAATVAGVPVHYVYRRDEKLHICGDSRAKDTNIRRALIDRFARYDLRTGRGTKANPDFFFGFSGDIWAAFAVGLTYIEGDNT